MGKKLIDLPLDELYAKPKMTPATRAAIASKEDFTKINTRYCDQVCPLPEEYKDPLSVSLKVDKRKELLVISRHPPVKEKWKDSKQLERAHMSILRFLFEKKLGYPRWTHTYMTKCTPDEKQTLTKCKGCVPYLIQQIRTLKPKVIVSTHTEVTKSLGLTKMSNNNNRGNVGYYVDEAAGLRIPVVLTLHPESTMMIRQNASGAMWGPDYLGVIHRDLLKAACLATGQMTLSDFDTAMAKIRANKQIVVTRTLDEVKHWCKKILDLGPKKIISWDTETSGLDAWAEEPIPAKLLTSQFGYRREDGLVQAVVIPLWHIKNTGYNADEAWPYVAEILTSDMTKVAHNAKFDLLYTTVTTGVRPLNVKFDTMLLLHALNSGISGNYSLKTAVWDYLLESGLGGYEDHLDIEHIPVEVADAD